jgi:hypothetical protein
VTEPLFLDAAAVRAACTYPEAVAAIEAALVEVPLAPVCVWLARNREHAVAAVAGVVRRRRGRRANP